MPTIVKTPSGTWKAVIRKPGLPTTVKTFRLKCDPEDWARTAEDEMVRGMFVKRSPSEHLRYDCERRSVSVRRFHLENRRPAADDGVHQESKWTPWKTLSALRADTTTTI